MPQDESQGRLDLNLLAIFDAIMTEGSLTKAGKRLGMTQSAVSHALARLREATGGDPLFERTGRGMRPTPVASAMYEKIRAALDVLRASVRAPGAFAPDRDERTFVLGMPFGFDTLFIPPIARRLSGERRLKFRVSPLRAGSLLAELRLGETLLAFDYSVPETQGLRAELLMLDPFVLIARAGHPDIAGAVSMDLFQSLTHAGLSWNAEHGSSPLTERLAALGVTRRINYTAPCVSTIPAMVEATDLVGMLPRRIARQFARRYAIELHPVPDAIQPMPVYLVWHESFDHDEGHVWLRGILHEVCGDL